MAYRLGQVSTEMSKEAYNNLMEEQYERWWHVDDRRMRSKGSIMRYCGRYAKRPPIAEHRFLQADEQGVRFRTKDLKLKRIVETEYTARGFIDALIQHVPDRYVNNIRYFGLLAPRSKCRVFSFIFELLGQDQRPKPRRLSWRASIKKSFGVDPLINSKGQRMRRIGRLAPKN